MAVTTSHGHRTDGGRPAAPGMRGHFACGLAGLAVVLAVFLTEYGVIATAADATLGVLSSTSILWLFVATWLVLWLGLDVALLQFTR